MKDRIIQIEQQFKDWPILGLSESGRLYKLEEYDGWVLIVESPDIDRKIKPEITNK